MAYICSPLLRILKWVLHWYRIFYSHITAVRLLLFRRQISFLCGLSLVFNMLRLLFFDLSSAVVTWVVGFWDHIWWDYSMKLATLRKNIVHQIILNIILHLFRVLDASDIVVPPLFLYQQELLKELLLVKRTSYFVEFYFKDWWTPSSFGPQNPFTFLFIFYSKFLFLPLPLFIELVPNLLLLLQLLDISLDAIYLLLKLEFSSYQILTQKILEEPFHL